MKAEFTEFGENSNWVNGKINEYTFEAKLYNSTSTGGINNGRVSKLAIKNKEDERIISYDRGWIKQPNKENIDYYDTIIELLENSPNRFTEYSEKIVK